MDDRRTVLVHDDADLERPSGRIEADEHRHLVVVRGEGPDRMSECMQHVFVWNAVPAGAGLDLHSWTVQTRRDIVNTC